MGAPDPERTTYGDIRRDGQPRFDFFRLRYAFGDTGDQESLQRDSLQVTFHIEDNGTVSIQLHLAVEETGKPSSNVGLYSIIPDPDGTGFVLDEHSRTLLKPEKYQEYRKRLERRLAVLPSVKVPVSPEGFIAGSRTGQRYEVELSE